MRDLLKPITLDPAKQTGVTMHSRHIEPLAHYFNPSRCQQGGRPGRSCPRHDPDRLVAKVHAASDPAGCCTTYPQSAGPRAYFYFYFIFLSLAGASRSQNRCLQDKREGKRGPPCCRHYRRASTYYAMPTFTPTGACSCLRSRSTMAVAKPWTKWKLDLSVPRQLRTNRWQVGDTT